MSVDDWNFGIAHPGCQRPGDWRQLVERVESFGLDALFLPDHFGKAHVSPLVSLAFVSTLTDQLTLGTMVLNSSLVHPAEVVRDARTLASLAGNRIVLGLGIGYRRLALTDEGLPFPPFGERLQRLYDVIAALGDAASPVNTLIGGASEAVLRCAGAAADLVGFIGLQERSNGELDGRDFGWDGLTRNRAATLGREKPTRQSRVCCWHNTSKSRIVGFRRCAV